MLKALRKAFTNVYGKKVLFPKQTQTQVLGSLFSTDYQTILLKETLRNVVLLRNTFEAKRAYQVLKPEIYILKSFQFSNKILLENEKKRNLKPS